MPNQTPRERHGELVQQLEDLVAQRETLKAEHSKALIIGKEFSKKQQLVEINHDIEALNAAIATIDEQATRQEEREHATQQADRLQRLLDDITSGEKSHLDDIRELEKHLAATSDILIRIRDHSKTMHDAIAAATKQSEVATFNSQNVSMRVSQQIGFFLSQVYTAGVYGMFRWMPEAGVPGNMVAREKQAIAGATQHSIKVLSGQIDELRRQASAE